MAWCEATLGITPGPGGEHKLFGTHNRLFKIATPANPVAYCEIIAINSEAVPQLNRALNAGLTWITRRCKPLWLSCAALVHFVASTPDVPAAVRSACRTARHRPGPCARGQPHRARKGLLQWQITVRDDGQRLFNGALPTLIQWGKPGDAEPMRLHPRNSLPRSGVTLQSMHLRPTLTQRPARRHAPSGLHGIAVRSGPLI